MSRNSGFKVAALAASIALAMGSTAAMAATTAPTTTQLPGKGTVVAGSAADSGAGIVNGEQTINITGNTVINWGSGTTLNPTGTGGFNIGSGAKLHFAGLTGGGTDAVLNIDSSGNASQIFGLLDTAGSSGTTNVFVANSNGVIVGSTATISGNVGLIANKLSSTAGTSFATDPNPVYNGTGGDVTVQKGASLSGTILISGGGNVNVDLSAINGVVNLSAGRSSANAGSFASNNTAAAITTTGQIGSGSLTGFDSAGNASNSGILNVSGAAGSVDGTFTNTGDLTLGSTNGAVHNQGKLTTAAGATFNGALTNDGTYAAGGDVTVNGADLANNGTLSGATNVRVNDGSVTNKGTISGVTGGIYTQSNDGNYTAGADYSITNSGSITGSGTGTLTLDANDTNHGTETANNTTGSVSNTGTLNVSGTELDMFANNDVNVAGTLKVGGSAISASNPLANFYAESTMGKATLSVPVWFSGYAEFDAPMIAVMANLTGGSSAGAELNGGPQLATDYAIRIGSGVAVTAPSYIYLEGYKSTDNPNVILQGTVASNAIYLGDDDGVYYGVSDVLTGPNGGLMATGSNPYVYIDATGRVKNAPYLNDANFRYNYLPITVTDDTAVNLYVDPAGYATAGTPTAAMNILVNGGVSLKSTGPGAIVGAGGSAVTGVNVIPNTHLVLQSTGNIATSGAFYWPGYVYLGNIKSNADGSAAPGTLGFGTITLGGDFNNVLPGDTSGAGGIHFITQYPLAMGGFTVTTNANSWVNFGTASLTAAYASGSQGNGLFYGGAQGSGNVVNYGALDASLFHTQAPDSSK